MYSFSAGNGDPHNIFHVSNATRSNLTAQQFGVVAPLAHQPALTRTPFLTGPPGSYPTYHPISYPAHPSALYQPPSRPIASASASTSAPGAPATQIPQKRTANPGSGRSKPASKRPRAQAPVTHAGVGPSTRINRNAATQSNIETAIQAAQSLPITYSDTRANTESTEPSKTPASGGVDCWALILGTTHTKAPPAEVIEEAKAAALAHTSIDPQELRRPSSKSYPRLLCLPCLTIKGEWHTWSNTNGGSTVGPRTHFRKEYLQEYLASCCRIGYCVSEFSPSQNEVDETVNEEITKEGIARHLAEFIADQDLSFNIVKASTFRRLLCYIGQNNIVPAMIPDRHVIANTVSDISLEEKERIKENMQDAKGRISITSDLWTDEMERSFMAVTGHYIEKGGESVVNLVAFRVVEGSHTGVNIGGTLFGILAEFDILHKIGSITLDNASNNDTMMEELQTRMRMEGYNFDKEGNRIRCFPHIINLAVNAFLDALPESGEVYRRQQESAGHLPSEKTNQYLAALASRPDKCCRETVVALRHGQRRRALKQTIKEGNEKGLWNYKELQPVKLADNTLSDRLEEVVVVVKLDQLELIHDCKTRWSSTRNMIERFIYLYPAISDYVCKNRESLAGYAISHLQFKVLQDILVVLDIPHKAQELLSFEQTPTLALAFPVYDSLICKWHQAAKRYPALAFAIRASISKVEDYIVKSRSSPIHIIAMFLNPCLKYTWIDENWPESDRQNARKIVERFMLEYAEAQDRNIEAEAATHNLSSKASKSLGHGLTNVLFKDGDTFRAPTYNSSFDVTPPCSPAASRIAPTPGCLSIPTSSISNASPSRIARNRKSMVMIEHDRYLASTCKGIKDLGTFDLVKHWNIQETFPVLRALSMDVLPAQASSVSSERVFSSSKLTCTRARNKISTKTVENLQILKYAIRHRRKVTASARHSQPNILTDNPNPDESDSTKTIEIMLRLGDNEWSHDAILDVDIDV